MIACWAVHRLGGICLLLHSTSSATEVQNHMDKAKCNVIFTCRSLLPTCLEVSKARSIEICLFDLPNDPRQSLGLIETPKVLAQLVEEGSQLDALENVKWEAGQGREQVAYLCPTSGTSGKQVRCLSYQKLTRLTHPFTSIETSAIDPLQRDLQCCAGGDL